MAKYLERRRFKIALPFVKGKLLDIGCGPNRFTKTYHGEGLGLDVHDWGDVDVLVDDSSNIPFPDKSFDTISMIAVIGHILNLKEVFKEAKRLLKNDGKIIFTSIDPRISKVLHFLVRHDDPDQTERGLHEEERLGYSFNEVMELLSETGFHLDYHTKFELSINELYVATPT